MKCGEQWAGTDQGRPAPTAVLWPPLGTGQRQRGSQRLSRRWPHVLLGKGGHLRPLGERGPRPRVRGHWATCPAAPAAPSAQAHLSAGQADDPLASLQLPAAVACVESAG